MPFRFGNKQTDGSPQSSPSIPRKARPQTVHLGRSGGASTPQFPMKSSADFAKNPLSFQLSSELKRVLQAPPDSGSSSGVNASGTPRPASLSIGRAAGKRSSLGNRMSLDPRKPNRGPPLSPKEQLSPSMLRSTTPVRGPPPRPPRRRSEQPESFNYITPSLLMTSNDPLEKSKSRELQKRVWTAAYEDDYEGMTKIVERYTQLCSSCKSEDGYTLLTYAASIDDSKMMQLLLEKGVDHSEASTVRVVHFPWWNVPLTPFVEGPCAFAYLL